MFVESGKTDFDRRKEEAETELHGIIQNSRFDGMECVNLGCTRGLTFV